VKAGIGRIRVVTYNIHKCRGMDRRIRPQRIVQVLREIDADVIALQEVVSAEGGGPEEDQAGYIAGALGLRSCMGENRRLNGGAYGNLLLSRYPLRDAINYDISTNGRERRGCLRVDLDIAGAMLLHVFNVHLGTAYLERRRQARMLLTSTILNNGGLRGARVVLGDFNEWLRGLATRLLSAEFDSVDIQRNLGRSRTYPGLLPLLHLDHIYFDPILTVESLSLHRSRTALIASDHLPLVVDFGRSSRTDCGDTEKLRA
jgi:endonuclease/exonuclease/phosphatase family metal-dependent hydrolase